jgi:hypothetical protein
MHQQKNVALASSVLLQRLNTGATPAGMTSTGANLDCLVNFLPRPFGERIFVDCSSSYGLFLVNDAAAFQPLVKVSSHRSPPATARRERHVKRPTPSLAAGGTDGRAPQDFPHRRDGRRAA